MTIQEQLLKVEAESRFAAAKADKNQSDIDYIAIMADIDLDDGEEESVNAQ